LLVKLAHPTIAGQDEVVKLVSDGQGMYTGKLAGEVAGRWRVMIEDPAGKWRLQGNWKADSGEALRLEARPVK
jgi:uncharacterized protein